jgi:hypothetical protein
LSHFFLERSGQVPLYGIPLSRIGDWLQEKLAKPKPTTLCERFLDQNDFDPGIGATLNGSGGLVETAVPGMFRQHTPPSVSHALFFYPGNSESQAVRGGEPIRLCDWGSSAMG